MEIEMSQPPKTKEVRIARWYFGGLASAGAASMTHPLDLLKVQLQTQKGKSVSMISMAQVVLKEQGILGLYNGISASMLRQMSYSTIRFGMYEVSKQQFGPKDGRAMSLPMSMFLAGISGCAGGIVGSPADLVNVRMQNDIKLPPEQRRNYKNAFHGLYMVIKGEGVTSLWTGATMNVARAILMTIGQLSFYDQIKALLLYLNFGDNVGTHVSSSLGAGAIATTMTQPVDVLKTRYMNAKPGEFSGVVHLVTTTVKEGPLAFFKGYVPAFVRLAPQTILTFVFMEQIRLNFGDIRIVKA